MPLSLPLSPLNPLLPLPPSNSFPLSPLPRLPLLPRSHPPQLPFDSLHLRFLLGSLYPRSRQDGFAGDLERGLEVGEFGREHVGDEGVGFGVEVWVEGAGEGGETGVSSFLENKEEEKASEDSVSADREHVREEKRGDEPLSQPRRRLVSSRLDVSSSLP